MLAFALVGDQHVRQQQAHHPRENDRPGPDMDDPCDSPAELDDPEVDGHERSRDERAERLEGENVPARRSRDAGDGVADQPGGDRRQYQRVVVVYDRARQRGYRERHRERLHRVIELAGQNDHTGDEERRKHQ